MVINIRFVVTSPPAASQVASTRLLDLRWRDNGGVRFLPSVSARALAIRACMGLEPRSKKGAAWFAKLRTLLTLDSEVTSAGAPAPLLAVQSGSGKK